MGGVAVLVKSLGAYFMQQLAREFAERSMGQHVLPNRNARMAKVRAQALGYELKVEEVGGSGCIRFIKESGQRDVVYGVWAAEIWLQAYRFAVTNVVPSSRAGSWKDDDEDDDDSWDTF